MAQEFGLAAVLSPEVDEDQADEEIQKLADKFDAVEELRWYGFRGDDIRSGEPRVRDLGAVGADRYWTLNQRIEPHRATPFFEVVWTVSRGKDDQPNPPRSATNDDNTIRGP